MMNELITQQQVDRRKNAPSVYTKAQEKPGAAELTGRGLLKGTVMAQIKQRPAPVQRFYKKKEPFFIPIISPAHRPMPAIVLPSGASDRADRADKKGSPPPPHSQRVFSLTRLTIIVLGGITIFTLVLLNRPRDLLRAFMAGFLPIGGAYEVEPGSDTGLQDTLAAYAGLSAPAQEILDGDAIPLNIIETFTWETYRVKKGDSISKIAANHAISMDAIIASNNISSAKLLQEGDVLRIPNMDGIPYTVKAGDSLYKISRTMGVPLEVILDANDIQTDRIKAKTQLFIPGAKMRSEDLKLVLGELFIYPVRGRLTSPFGWRKDPITGARRFHAALDLAASTGTPVKAAMEGRVSTVGLNSVYGKYIIVTHNNGYQTMYAHLNAASVTQGTYVSQGAKIGEVGSTGYSTGPHLHFALYKNGRAVNPLDFLKS
ncbi:MAG: M23 family metallopeptidase [Spirochaetaceae bacterium]|jgi:murein DD-endopeptidase MepM/ murein hydrolase activator NlpD|nr:M23 family metallopeptidase [Spirochaetaceae bacterium]